MGGANSAGWLRCTAHRKLPKVASLQIRGRCRGRARGCLSASPKVTKAASKAKIIVIMPAFVEPRLAKLLNRPSQMPRWAQQIKFGCVPRVYWGLPARPAHGMDKLDFETEAVTCSRTS